MSREFFSMSRRILLAMLAIASTVPAFAQTQPTRPSAYATFPTQRSAWPTAPLNPCPKFGLNPPNQLLLLRHHLSVVLSLGSV